MASQNSNVRKQLGIAGRSEYSTGRKRRGGPKSGQGVKSPVSDTPASEVTTNDDSRQRTREVLLRERTVLKKNLTHLRQAEARIRDVRRARAITEPTEEELALGRRVQLMRRRLRLIERWLASHPTPRSEPPRQSGEATNKDTAQRGQRGKGKAKGKGKKGVREPQTSRSVRRGRVLAGAPTGRTRGRATLIS